MRHFTLVLVLPTIVFCTALASAQDRYFYFNQKQDSVPIWTQDFIDSLTKEFNLKGLTIPKWPNQEQKELLPQYPYPEFFTDPRLPGLPVPDLRNRRDRNNDDPRRVIPKRRDGKEIPNFPGWRIEKLKNLARA
jgi:hypothetical protein